MINRRTTTFDVIIFTLLYSFIFNSTITAQLKIQAGSYFGIGIRMIIGVDRNELGMGYHVGIISRVPVNKHFFVLPSVFIARKGY